MRRQEQVKGVSVVRTLAGSTFRRTMTAGSPCPRGKPLGQPTGGTKEKPGGMTPAEHHVECQQTAYRCLQDSQVMSEIGSVSGVVDDSPPL